MMGSDLKIQALLERIGQLTVDYENRVADLRVELTEVTLDRDSIKKELQTIQDSHEEEKVVS